MKDNLPLDIRRNLLMVPACKECNCWLSNRHIIGINARREYIKMRIRTKYKRYLARIKWDDDEMEDFGYVLKAFISAEDAKSRLVISRLMWPNA